MRFRSIFAFLLMAVMDVTLVHGQNLIVNPSFEEYSVPCEDVWGQGRIYDAHGWERASRNFAGDSDLISPCSIDNYRPPSNLMGYQIPRFGENYCLFGSTVGWYSINDNFIGIESVQPSFRRSLIPDSCYYFQLDMSRPEAVDTIVSFGLDLLFTREDFTFTQFTVPNVSPQYSLSNLDTLSTVSWTRITKKVILQDTSEYLTLAWFNIPQSYPDGTLFSAGYYIDNVVLYPCDAPVFSADAGEDITICKGDSVELSTPYRNNEYMYWWVNAYGDTISTERTLWVDDSPGTYYLAQLDFKFDVTWDTVSVFNKSCLELELPNVFTPNDDGQNDLWKPKGKDIGQIDLQIYSRWGQLIWSYSGRYEDLNGWNGGDASEGTYYVVAKDIGIDGKTVEEKGTLTLLR